MEREPNWWRRTPMIVVAPSASGIGLRRGVTAGSSVRGALWGPAGRPMLVHRHDRACPADALRTAEAPRGGPPHGARRRGARRPACLRRGLGHPGGPRTVAARARALAEARAAALPVAQLHGLAARAG